MSLESAFVGGYMDMLLKVVSGEPQSSAHFSATHLYALYFSFIGFS